MNKLLTMISAVALLTAIAGSAYAQKTVFVTSVSFKGNLGGLTGADDKCQAQADDGASIVPSGTYLAWLGWQCRRTVPDPKPTFGGSISKPA